LPGEGWLKGNFQGPFRNRELNMMDSQLNKAPVFYRGAFFKGAVDCRDHPIFSRSAPDTGKISNLLSGKCTPFFWPIPAAWNFGIPTELSRMMTHVE